MNKLSVAVTSIAALGAARVDGQHLVALPRAADAQAIFVDDIAPTGWVAMHDFDPVGRTRFSLVGGGEVVSSFTGAGYSFFDGKSINASGTVAGDFWAIPTDDVPMQVTAVLWQNGKFAALANPDPMSGYYTHATDINDSSVIVGAVESFDGQHAVRWDDGRPSLLEPNRAISWAHGVTNGGLVYGAIRTPDFYWAPVLWRDDHRQILSLPVPNSSWGGVIKANDNDQSLIFYYLPDDSSGTYYAFYDGGAMTLFGGGQEFEANDLAADGSVVGESDGRAFLWRGGQFQDLNDLIDPASGWLLTHASAINDAGQIAGIGTYQGVETAFLLTLPTNSPIPEPAAASLALAVWRVHCRRRVLGR